MIVVVSFDAFFSHVKVLQNNQSVEWLWNFRRKTHTQRRKAWMLLSRALYTGHLHTVVGYWFFRNSRSLWKSNFKGILSEECKTFMTLSQLQDQCLLGFNSEIRWLSFRLVKRFPQVPAICFISHSSSEKQLEDSIKRFAAKENPSIEKHRLAIACTTDVI